MQSTKPITSLLQTIMDQVSAIEKSGQFEEPKASLKPGYTREAELSPHLRAFYTLRNQAAKHFNVETAKAQLRIAQERPSEEAIKDLGYELGRLDRMSDLIETLFWESVRHEIPAAMKNSIFIGRGWILGTISEEEARRRAKKRSRDILNGILPLD